MPVTEYIAVPKEEYQNGCKCGACESGHLCGNLLETIEKFADWYYFTGNVDNPEYRTLTEDIEARMLAVLGERKIKP